MCADWSIHDKGDGNPHVHLLLTMRPFNPDHSWGKKEVKDWDFVRDKNGNIVIDESHPNWWQDKKNPDRHGIRIPVLDENGIQKIGARNRLQWKRVLTDATGWNNPKIVNCGGVNGQRYVMNICLCIIKLIIVLMKSRENSRFLPSMKELTQERLNKSFCRAGNKRLVESSGKSNHKTTKHVIAKDTKHLWESIGCIIIMEGAIK